MISAAAIIIIIRARVDVADAFVDDDTLACLQAGGRCRDRFEIAPSRRRAGIVTALQAVGEEVAAAAAAVVVVVGKVIVDEGPLHAEAGLENRLFRGARGDARVGERYDVATRDEVDIAVIGANAMSPDDTMDCAISTRAYCSLRQVNKCVR